MVGALGAGASGCVVDDTYEACVEDADCNDPADRCVAVTVEADRFGEATSGGFCTHECASDAECEYNLGWAGVCYALQESAASLCYQQCEVDTDCWGGNVCRRVALDELTDDLICVPSS